MNTPAKYIEYKLHKLVDFSLGELCLQKFEEKLQEFKEEILKAFPVEFENKHIVMRFNAYCPNKIKLEYHNSVSNPNFEKEMEVYNEWVEVRRQEKLVNKEKDRKLKEAAIKRKIEEQNNNVLQAANQIKEIMENPEYDEEETDRLQKILKIKSVCFDLSKNLR